MKERLDGKVVVITGASSGFGKGAALQFASLGAYVVVAARRDYLLDELVAACNNADGKALAVPTDVSVQADMEALFDAAIKEFGHIDIWVNNAGGAAVGEFTQIPIADHKQVIDVDLMGTIYGSHLAMKHFRASNAGTLINIASMIGRIPAPYYSSYSAAKHGVVGLSASLRQELAELKIKDIHVCTVLPMAMDTPFFEHAANYTDKQTVAIPPLSDAQDVIEAIVSLATKPKDEVAVGKGAGVFSVSDALNQGVTEKLMAATTQKAMDDAPPAPPTPGSLSTPDPSGTGIHSDKL